MGLPLAVEFAKALHGGAGRAGGKWRTNRGATSDVAAECAAGGGGAAATTSYDTCTRTRRICVPTPLRKTKDPDMSYVIAAADAVAAVCHPGLLVVLESTTYPGTTEEVILPRLLGNGLTVGEDVFVAFSPERVDPGNPTYGVHNTPKVVGGVTPACVEMVSTLYAPAVGRVMVCRRRRRRWSSC